MIRPYQADCVQAVIAAIAAGERQLYYQLPTGTGKTFVATEILRHYLIECDEFVYDQALFVIHRKELVEQTAAAFRRDLPEVDTGVIMATYDDKYADIAVCTIQSLSPKRTEQVLGNRGRRLVIIDEAHHCTNDNSYGRFVRQVLEADDRNVVIGCTATPFRTLGSMQDVLPSCVYIKTIEESQNEGYLCPTQWKPIHLDVDFTRVKIGQREGEKDYNAEQMADTLTPYLQTLVEKTVPLLGTRATVTFSPTIDQAERLASLYQQAGIASSYICADLTRMSKAERERRLVAWKAGEIQLMSNVGILTEGFDFPNIGAVVVARPTMAPGLYLQMIGRGTRLKDATYGDALIIDVCSNANLLEVQQIVLPKVYESISDDVEAILADPSLLDRPAGEKKEEEDQPVGMKQHTWKILDPANRTWVSWGRRDGLYWCEFSRRHVCILKRQQSGLYRGYILDFETKKKHHITKQPQRIEDLLQQVNLVLAQNPDARRLADKNARWHFDPATPQQQELLRNKNKELPDAVIRSMTKIQISQAITWEKIKDVIAQL